MAQFGVCCRQPLWPVEAAAVLLPGCDIPCAAVARQRSLDNEMDLCALPRAVTQGPSQSLIANLCCLVRATWVFLLCAMRTGGVERA